MTNAAQVIQLHAIRNPTPRLFPHPTMSMTGSACTLAATGDAITVLIFGSNPEPTPRLDIDFIQNATPVVVTSEIASVVPLEKELPSVGLANNDRRLATAAQTQSRGIRVGGVIAYRACVVSRNVLLRLPTHDARFAFGCFGKCGLLPAAAHAQAGWIGAGPAFVRNPSAISNVAGLATNGPRATQWRAAISAYLAILGVHFSGLLYRLGIAVPGALARCPANLLYQKSA